MTLDRKYWDNTGWTLPFLRSNRLEQLQEIATCGSSDLCVQISDYERLEQANQAVKQAEERFDMIQPSDDELLESAIYQLKSAELLRNAVIKELKAKKQ